MKLSIQRTMLCALICSVVLATCGVFTMANGQDEESHEGHDHLPVAAPRLNFLTPEARDALNYLMVQDFQGRMKPLDTLARESVMKVTKKHSFKDWEPLDLFISWMAHPNYWYEQPVIAVRFPDLKRFLGISQQTKHVSLMSMIDDRGQYRLREDMGKTHRTPDRDRTKVQRKLISFDERVNLFNMVMRGIAQRIFPVPGHENSEWLAPSDLDGEVAQTMEADTRKRFQDAFGNLFRGAQAMDAAAIEKAARQISDLQYAHGASVMPTEAARNAELKLNRMQPFTWASLPYLGVFMVLMAAYAWSLARMNGRRFALKHPLYLLGMLIYLGTIIYHIYGYVLRWQASGRAPLSNGYESLIFISVTIAVAGFYYELRSRRGSIGALGGLMTGFILGVAMLPTFDPAITPLVPVLSSVWLIIHVTIITASYGFLALGCVIAMTMLILNLFKGPGRLTLRRAIVDLHGLHWNVLVAGLAFLTVGTFLGGVWANESWGRYWGWDPKETWSLVTILVYAFVIHFKFVESLNHPLKIAAGSFLSIFSIAMTYFGVNYFLSGLHSYASGSAPEVPNYVYVTAAVMLLLVFASFMVDKAKSWEDEAAV